MVDRWGSLWYGEEWKYERKRIIAKAGFYFLLEFIIGFPKQRRGCVVTVSDVFSRRKVHQAESDGGRSLCLHSGYDHSYLSHDNGESSIFTLQF
jgi:hypothetical protein